MTQEYKARITYDIKDSHPDFNEYKSTQNNVYSDVYRFNMDVFTGDPLNYIKYDLKLIAGGGYDYKSIKNIKFNINRIK